MTDLYTEEAAIWSGDLNIDVFDADGNLTGERDVGNASVFAAGTPSVEKKELTGSRRSNYGTTIKSIITKNTQEFNITLTDVNKRNLALAMLGEDSVYTQTAGDNTASPENVTAVLDKWVKMSKRNLDPENPPVVKDVTDTTTYVEDTDYVIDYTVGRIIALSTGDIDDADVLHVGNTWLSHTGYIVSAAENLTIEARLRLIMDDQASTRSGEVIIYKAQIEPAGDLSWITEDFTTIQLKASVLDYSGQFWDVYMY